MNFPNSNRFFSFLQKSQNRFFSFSLLTINYSHRTLRIEHICITPLICSVQQIQMLQQADATRGLCTSIYTFAFLVSSISFKFVTVKT